MLELRDFITRILEDVQEGIAAAQQSSKFGKNIAPDDLANLHFPPDSGVYAGGRFLSTTIKFDVAVAAEATDKAEGKGAIRIAVFSVGASGESASRTGTTHHIQFAVPVTFPQR